jgi:hemoglobin-like flavoprotein
VNEFTRRVRRIFLGPDTIDPRTAYDKARNPIPPIANTQPPITAGYLPDGRTVAFAPSGAVMDMTRARQKAADTIAANRVDGFPAIRAEARRSITNDLGISVPPPGRPYAIPDLDRAIPNVPARQITTGDDMDDTPRAHTEPGNEDAGMRPSPYPREAAEQAVAAGRRAAFADEPDPLTDSGVHALDDTTDREQITVTMTVTRYTNDLLTETAGMLPEDSASRDDAIREFYRRLLTAAPDLAFLFPPDLLTAAHGSGDPGAVQRDRLLAAILALADTYGAGPEAMQRLDNVIVSMGHRHAAFARADGTVEGATEAEYDAVIAVFLQLMRDALGDQFTDLHWKAWMRALRYVKVGMLWAQYHSGASYPRMPRQASNA